MKTKQKNSHKQYVNKWVWLCYNKNQLIEIKKKEKQHLVQYHYKWYKKFYDDIRPEILYIVWGCRKVKKGFMKKSQHKSGRNRMMGRISIIFIECQLYTRLHARIWHKGGREGQRVVTKKEKKTEFHAERSTWA
jgi:hypothetical protein